MLVYFLYHIFIFYDELEGNHIASSMDSLVCSGATNKRRLLWVVGIGFRYGTSRDESLKKVAFDGFLRSINLHAFVSRPSISNKNSDFAFWSSFFGFNLFL